MKNTCNEHGFGDILLFTLKYSKPCPLAYFINTKIVGPVNVALIAISLVYGGLLYAIICRLHAFDGQMFGSL